MSLNVLYHGLMKCEGRENRGAGRFWPPLFATGCSRCIPLWYFLQTCKGIVLSRSKVVEKFSIVEHFGATIFSTVLVLDYSRKLQKNPYSLCNIYHHTSSHYGILSLNKQRHSHKHYQHEYMLEDITEKIF